MLPASLVCREHCGRRVAPCVHRSGEQLTGTRESSALGRRRVPASLRLRLLPWFSTSAFYHGPAVPLGPGPALPGGARSCCSAPGTRVSVLGWQEASHRPGLLGAPRRGRDVAPLSMRSRHTLPHPKCRLRSGSWGSGGAGWPVLGTPPSAVPTGQRDPAGALVILGRPWKGSFEYRGWGTVSHLPDNPIGPPGRKSQEESPRPPGGEWRSKAPRWSQHVWHLVPESG